MYTGNLDLPFVLDECMHNAHMFYVKTKNLEERTKLISFLKERVVNAVFHYVPLHSSEAGQRFGRFCGEDFYTTQESDRLVRLPMYFGLEEKDVNTVISAVKAFYCVP